MSSLRRDREVIPESCPIFTHDVISGRHVIEPCTTVAGVVRAQPAIQTECELRRARRDQLAVPVERLLEDIDTSWNRTARIG